MKPERWKQIEQLYEAALERAASQRAAFLAQACGNDEALRQEVESLLDYEARGERLIDRPALEAAARAMAEDQIGDGAASSAPSLVGQSVGHFRILSLLGKGGMGDVWLAEDAHLSRRVAVKLLPADFTADAGRLRRFAQEARTASALNHPNIITIYEIGEAGKTHYIVTEYVEGETLRQRMAGAPQQRLQASEAIEIAVQIAAALSAAHEAGIMHRDIKPENVMVRRDGIVKVLDFGLAKLTEPGSPVMDPQASTLTRNSTEAGVMLGTPRYMSPEQARGERVDARTDIFSLGVLVYEMIAGHTPFSGTTLNEMIAAILRDEPPPLAKCAPDAPPELERIVGKALRKNREERYQNADDLLTDLKQLSRDREFTSEAKNRSGRAKAAGGTANRRRLAAVVALAGLVMVAIGAWFYFNRSPVLTSRDAILLADFENQTGDEIFDGMLKQGLAVQLQQSPVLNIFPEAQVRRELGLMRRAPNERVTAELAREICQRQNLKAWIAGSIVPLGSYYVITLEAAHAQSGEVLAHEQVEAKSKEQVLRALSQATTQLRERLGESLSSIQKSVKLSEEATTSNLEAFKFYSEGAQQAISGRGMEAIPALKRAVEIDRDFAYAYSLLAVTHGNTDRPGLAAEYAEKSYALRDRVTEYEKLRITNWYHSFVTGDVNRRIETLLLEKRMFPAKWAGGPSDLASAYNHIGQSEEAIAEARESIRLIPSFAHPYRQMAIAMLRLNHFAEAKAAIAQALQLNLDTPDFHAVQYQIAFTEGATAGMQAQLDWARGRPDEYLALGWQAGAAAFSGEWRRSQELLRRAIERAARGDTTEVAARYATEQALRGALFGDCRQAKAGAAGGLSLARGRASLPRAALALALCGETNQAKPLVGELTKRYPEDTIINELWLPAIRAAVDLWRGNAAQAIEQLQAATRYEAAAEFWPQHLRGQAYLKLKRGAEAAAEFQKILDHRGHAPLSPLYPLANLGLARAAALSGDTEKSRKAYEEFFAAWKEADAGLPILREAKRES